MVSPRHAHVNKLVAVVAALLLVGLWSALRPASAQNTTPTPNPTLQAGVTGDFPQGSPIYGPESGEIVHDPDDTFVAATYIDYSIANFVLEVTFINPFDPGRMGWSHGIFFRDDGQDQYRLIFDSDGNWELTYVTASDFVTLQTGTLEDVQTGKSERNTLRLVADGPSGLFSFNDTVVAALDLSDRTSEGDLALGTGLYTDTEVLGAVTGYEDFRVWSIGILPTRTPTATAIAARDEAVVGSNAGEIEVGGGQVWLFEGQAGERFSFRIMAARPAGRQSDQEERMRENLYDAYLIIRDPDGVSIAENDDNEEVSDDDPTITNSFITLTLPVTGRYELEVRSYADETGGEYTLEITRVRQFVPQGGAGTPTPSAGGGRG